MVDFHLELHGELFAQAQDQGQASHTEQPAGHKETREADMSDPLTWVILGSLAAGAAILYTVDSRIRRR